jgi:two-component system OmpR family sensor kinase
MSIRSRLAIAVGFVLLVTLFALGVSTVRSTRTILIDNVEQKILTSIAEFQRPGGGLDLNDIGRPSPSYLDNPVAVVVMLYDGTTSYSPSGYAESPDNPPNVPDLDSATFDKLTVRFGTISSEDGKLHYRARIAPVRQGGAQVGWALLAAPLDDVQATVASLVRKLIISGVMALVVAIAASWMIIRQGLRPVERMIDTASAIAGGDLTQRVPASATDPHTEIGQLGTALNEMLGHIEHSLNLRAESEARLRQFVADAAHELRTPLTSLRGYAELYRQGALPTPDAVSNAMGRIESEGTRMARLVDELLLLARLDQQRGLELAPVDLVTVCQEAIADFRAVEPNRPVSGDLAESAMVLGDRLRLRQVIDNLLTNVRVHTPPGTPVQVGIRINGQQVFLRVHDEGPGIPAEDQPHVFERFWRGDRSRGRRAGSSGLGLSIVASLVESHGGRISVASDPGHGTTFTVELPLASPGDVVV